MILYFEKNDLNLNVKLGALESYECTEEIRNLVATIDLLKKQKDEFLKEIYQPKLKEILEEVERLNIAANPTLTEMRKNIE